MVVEEDGSLSQALVDRATRRSPRRLLHQTIRKVTEDIEELHSTRRSRSSWCSSTN
jgi:hypothetical protein